MSQPPVLAVIGHGMVGHRFLEACVARGVADTHRIVVYGDERHPAYDRIGLSRYFEGTTFEEMQLGTRVFRGLRNVRLELGVGVQGVSTETKTIRLTDGRLQAYDTLVLATGATPFVPPVPGVDLDGVFVYRTLDDLTGISAGAAGATAGLVVGGGLLGLEAANALRLLGLQTTVVELSPWLLPVQVDDGGGQMLRRYVEGLGLDVLTSTSVASFSGTERITGATLSDGRTVNAQVAVVAAGVRPNDRLAREAGIAVGERGGVLIDEACQTSAPGVYAIGDVAAFGGRAVGLVAPGYAMAEVVADRLAGGAAAFAGADVSTALKLLGADVASVGDAHGTTEGALSLVFADPVAGTYRKLVVTDDGSRLLGAVLVGDTEAYAEVRALVAAGGAVERSVQDLLLPAREGTPGPSRQLSDEAQVCTCNNVTVGAVRASVRSGEADSVPAIKACTKAGTSCGSCVPTVRKLLDAELRAAGRAVNTALCEHFAHSRQELYSLMRVRSLHTWSATVRELGQGAGCDICKPAVASILATIAPVHVLDGENATLQDTNDHLMANLQKDGTYSVVPRIAGGEITPDKLAAIAATASEFGLYVKITGAQRIDMFGAQAHQLPAIWRRLVDAGMESGHAYGKALRTVKSCVGDSWCRFGVGDSVGLAVELELRYRGLRAPHKLKSGVSGCARECAEARGKDFGVIATETGWNLYVCGNGGFTPRHAQLLASDLDKETLIRYIDRFLMFYIRTADRLQRTAPWLESLEGGLDYLHAVVVDDSLGIAAELEADMANHVQDYRDEWAETLADPEKLRRFGSFVNAPDADDPNIVRIAERGMHRAATPAERPEREVLVAGPVIRVGAR